MKMISSDSIYNSENDDREIDLICQSAVRYIGISNKTSGRVARYLQQKGYDEGKIEIAIDRLKDRLYIDDFAIARRMIRLRNGRRSVSARAHRHYMVNAGVCVEAVETVLMELPPDEKTAPLALVGKYDNKVDCKMESMIRFLCGRGYSFEVAQRAVAEFINKKDKNE